jgi:hypothetical protein
MNFAHVHLLLNHLPILGIPVSAIFLAHGLYKGNKASQKFSLVILILFSLAALPVYLSGGKAEDVIEHLPGVAESWIESHEDAALASLILALVTGVLASAALVWSENEKRFRPLVRVVLILALVSTASLAYTGMLGGQVRHTEVRPTDSPAATDHGQ